MRPGHQRLYPFEHARRRRIELWALEKGFFGLAVQRLLSKALIVFDAATHLRSGVAFRSSKNGGMLELAALLVRHKHLFS